jgi:hypothetical protein
MSLKKLILVALAMTFILSTGVTLMAQTQVPHFILSGTTFQVRQHGQTEVLGDITLTCDVAGTFPVPAALTVVYTPIYSIVNDNAGVFTSGSAVPFNTRAWYAESEPATTAIRIIVANLNTVTNNSVTVQVSGAAVIGDIIRLMGIRANIGDANLPVNTQVNGTVIAIPPNAFQIDNTNTFPVAYVLDEIKVTTSPALGMLICQPANCKAGGVTVTEKFPSALTTVTDENDIQHKPYYGKPASLGTQLIFTIANILPGVKVSWPAGPISGTVLLQVTLPSGAPTSYTNNTTAPTSVTVTYNVTRDSEVDVESVTVPFTFCPVGIPVPPVFGTVTVQVQLGPNAGTLLGPNQPSANILSFVRNPLNTPPDGIASLTACVTNLLCKFLSTATGAVAGGGYDTGLAIANTSSDIFGSKGALAQQGACRVYLFGTGGNSGSFNPKTTPIYTTPVVAPGTDSVFSLISTAGVGAGFQGYAIVQCDFQYAHAEAIIADKQFSTFSHGYDCLIIPDVNVTGGRQASPWGGGVTGSGESLEQKRAQQ